MKTLIICIIALFMMSCTTINHNIKCKTRIVGPEKNVIEICK